MSMNSNQLLLHQMRPVLVLLLIVHIAYYLEYQKNCQSCFMSERLTRSGLITHTVPNLYLYASLRRIYTLLLVN